MNEASRIKVLVAMPAYNEEKYIGTMVLLARRHADEVLVVDDGSIDRSARVAELAGATVIRHAQNQGYGGTIQTIFSEARQRSPDVLVILDADAQHNADEMPALIKAISEGYDVVIGSREMQSNVIPAYRRLGQRILTRLTRVASQQKLSDTESGFRAYSRKAINSIELKEKGMAVSSEIVSEASRKGLKIKEVPISVTYTKDGSTINPIKHGLGVLNRIMIMISERRPLLVFGACGTICIILGVVLGAMVVYALYVRQVLQVGSALLSMMLITIGILSISTGLILNVLVRRINEALSSTKEKAG